MSHNMRSILRFLPVFLFSLLASSAFADDSPTSKKFMTERGLNHKETALYCTQANNYLQHNYSAFSAAYPDESSTDPIGNIQDAFSFWSGKSIYMYGGTDEAEAAHSKVNSLFTTQLTRTRQSVFASQPSQKGSLSALYLEVLQCRELKVEEEAFTIVAQLSANAYGLELLGASLAASHDGAWDNLPSEPPFITMSTNKYAPVLEMALVPGCNECHAQIEQHFDRLRELIEAGRITLRIMDTASPSNKGFARDVSQLSQCVYRRQGARAYFETLAALPGSIELATGSPADQTTRTTLSQHGDQIVEALEQRSRLTLTDCFGGADRDRIWNAQIAAVKDRQALIPGADLAKKFVWRGTPYFGDLNDVPEIAALK